MRALDSRNPAVTALFFIAVVVITIFAMNPVISAISLSGALALKLISGNPGNKKTHIFISLMAFGCCILNPLFSHNGKTVLLVINNAPVTLEAGLYGAAMGVMIAAAFWWCASLTEIMTSDKVVYTVGTFSPKAALVITMALRFIPLFVRKSREINDAEKTTGFYKDETIITRIKGISEVFSAMLTYIIENTIITADSMAARGYSGEKRSRYALFSFSPKDFAFAAASLLSAGIAVFSEAKGALDFGFYPEITGIQTDAVSIIGYVSFGILCLIPTLTEGGNLLRWRYLKSKISASHIPAQGK